MMMTTAIIAPAELLCSWFGRGLDVLEMTSDGVETNAGADVKAIFGAAASFGDEASATIFDGVGNGTLDTA